MEINKSQTVNELDKTQVVLQKIVRTKAFKIFIQSLPDNFSDKDIRFHLYYSEPILSEREWNETERKKKVFTKKIETQDNKELQSKIEEQMKSKELVKDADGSYSYEE